MRIDKWLWCARVFKSRTLASDACNGGKVKIKGDSVKPSREIKTGEIITVQNGFIKRQYKVKGLLDKRLAAKLITDYVEDLTPQEEKDKEKMLHLRQFYREKGLGRPTKKDRREITRHCER